jgi:hypothetical protein
VWLGNESFSKDVSNDDTNSKEERLTYAKPMIKDSAMTNERMYVSSSA